MLFDLRSGARRRTVKIVYLGLALLMFVGFVGFSIGSSGLQGGIVDAITGNGSSGGGGTPPPGPPAPPAPGPPPHTTAPPPGPPPRGPPDRRRPGRRDQDQDLAVGPRRLERARQGARPPRLRGRQLRLGRRRLHRRGQAPARRRRRRMGQVRRAGPTQTRRAS